MTVVKIIIALILFIVGMGIIDKNANGEPWKHNFLMGFIGYTLVVFSATIFATIIT